MINMAEDTKHSEAKAIIAQQKARDPTTGRFLDPSQQQQVAQQHQAVATEQQRQKLNSLFGRTASSPQSNPIQGNLPSPQPQNNFQAILAANKPGASMNVQQSEDDKWNTLLGKKKSNIQW